MSDSPYIYEVTAENYQQIVIEGSSQVPVLVDFWASWCQPCQMLMPVLAQLADEYQGKFVLAKINTEEQQAIAAQFGIRSIPTVKLFKNGAEVDQFAGALPAEQIRAFLDKHLPRETDGVAAAAQQLLEAGDANGALAMLTPAQAKDPGNWALALMMAQAHGVLQDWDAAMQILDVMPQEEQDKSAAKILRGQIYFGRHAPTDDELAACQQRLQHDPDDSEARYQSALAVVLQQDFSTAMELLLDLMRRDREYGDGAARQALLMLFDMLGDHPLVAQGRRRLFNLMH